MNLFSQWQEHHFYSPTCVTEVHVKERDLWELGRVVLWQMPSLTVLTNTGCSDRWPNRRCWCCRQLWLKPSLPTDCLLLPLSCAVPSPLPCWAAACASSPSSASNKMRQENSRCIFQLFTLAWLILPGSGDPSSHANYCSSRMVAILPGWEGDLPPWCLVPSRG